jgi:hypothetical protein
MYFDGSKRVKGAGAGVVLISPQGDKHRASGIASSQCKFFSISSSSLHSFVNKAKLTRLIICDIAVCFRCGLWCILCGLFEGVWGVYGLESVLWSIQGIGRWCKFHLYGCKTWKVPIHLVWTFISATPDIWHILQAMNHFFPDWREGPCGDGMDTYSGCAAVMPIKGRFRLHILLRDPGMFCVKPLVTAFLLYG